MYKDLQPTCPAIVLLIKLFVWRRSRCRCRCRWLKAASDTTSKEFQLKTRRGFSFTVRSSLHCNLDAFELKLYRTLLDKDRENHRCSLINQVMYYMIIFFIWWVLNCFCIKDMFQYFLVSPAFSVDRWWAPGVDRGRGAGRKTFDAFSDWSIRFQNRPA